MDEGKELYVSCDRKHEGDLHPRFIKGTGSCKFQVLKPVRATVRYQFDIRIDRIIKLYPFTFP
jgi:hypothetical protein